MMSGHDRIRVLSVELLSHKRQDLEFYTVQYERNDGSSQELQREIYRLGDGAAGLLYDLARRTVILVRQFRLPAYLRGDAAWVLEAPAGFLDGVSPEERVKLEIAEEAGFRVQHVHKVFEALMIPGGVTHVVHGFVAPYTPADRIDSGGGVLEEGEDIEVVELSIDDALAMVAGGKIVDGKTIMLLQYAALSLLR
jgi:nudix-type nucleoside diphosphatase (YffH/AdpP family)